MTDSRDYEEMPQSREDMESNIAKGNLLETMTHSILENIDAVVSIYKGQHRDKNGEWISSPDRIAYLIDFILMVVECKNWVSRRPIDKWNFKDKILTRFTNYEKWNKIKRRDYIRVCILAGIPARKGLVKLLRNEKINTIFIPPTEDGFGEKVKAFTEECMRKIINSDKVKMYYYR